MTKLFLMLVALGFIFTGCSQKEIVEIEKVKYVDKVVEVAPPCKNIQGVMSIELK